MSAIKNGIHTVELNGKEYGLLFSLNALDDMQDKFGGYDKLSEAFSTSNPDWVKDTKWLFTLLLNEALFAEDENATPLTEQQVGRMVHMGNLKNIQQAIFAAFAKGTAGEHEAAGTETEEGDVEEDTEGNTAAVQGN